MDKRYTFSVFEAVVSVVFEEENPENFFRVEVKEFFSTKESAENWSKHYINTILKSKGTRSAKLIDIKEVPVYTTP